MATEHFSCPRCGASSQCDAENFCVGEDCPIPDGEFPEALREFFKPPRALICEQECSESVIGGKQCAGACHVLEIEPMAHTVGVPVANPTQPEQQK